MATWSITPTDATINSSGVATFPENTGTTSKNYTITYVDDNGCSVSTTYTVPSGSECQTSCGEDYEFTLTKNNTVPISGDSSPAQFQVKYMGQYVYDYTESDFVVTVTGDYAHLVTGTTIWRPGAAPAPYLMSLITNGSGSTSCGALNSTLHVKLAMRDCPDAFVEYDCVFAGRTWTLIVTPTSTYTAALTVHTDAWVTGCNGWEHMTACQCTYSSSTGKLTGEAQFYPNRDIDFTKGLSIIGLESDRCDDPSSATITSIDEGGATLYISYNPNYC